MAVYEYQAIAKSGKRVSGVIDADTPAAARRKLRDMGLFPTEVGGTSGKAGPAGKGKGVGAPGGRYGGARISGRDVSLLTRQLAVLIAAGMPLVESLSALIEQTPNARLQKVIYEVRGRVNEGARLADALAAHSRVFTELYVNMVGAGEASGALEQVLFRLADIQERQVRLTKRVQSMLWYPAIMCVVGSSVVIFLMTAIVPKIGQMFMKQGRDLPAVTQLLINTADFVGSFWYLIIAGVIGVALAWRYWISRPKGRRKWDSLKLRIPIFSGVYTKLLTGRVARTMGTMLSSGLTMMTSLEVVKSVCQNCILEEGMDEVKASVRRGKDLSVPLREMNVFPAMMISMVELGQRSGELDAMLLKVADTYDEEVELNVDAVISLLEPAIILIMAVFVGFLVIAILLPIFDMSSGF